MYGQDLQFVAVCYMVVFGFLFTVMIAEHFLNKRGNK